MKLLYIVQYWPALFIHYICREMQWMTRRGHQIAIVALERDWSEEYVDLAGYGLKDVPVLYPRQMGEWTDGSIDDVIDFIRRHESQVIDAHSALNPGELALRVHKATGIPYCVRMVGSDVHTRPSAMLQSIADYAAVLCPVSEFLRNLLVANQTDQERPSGLPINVSPDRIRIVYHGVPEKQIATTAAPQQDGLQIIGSIGRINASKGQMDILEATAPLASEFPGVRLRFIGGGVMADSLKDRAEALKIADRVEITGHLRWTEAMRLAAGLHIYIQASKVEGLPVSSIEGIALGVPVILSRTGVHQRCVEENINGYLFDAGDVSSLREHIARLLRLGALGRQRMGEASLRIARERFVFENLMPRVESIYYAVKERRPLPDQAGTL